VKYFSAILVFLIFATLIGCGDTGKGAMVMIRWFAIGVLMIAGFFAFSIAGKKM
jgi:hypothetical protein